MSPRPENPIVEPHPGVKGQVGPVQILRAGNGHWRWWCESDNATSMGSLMPHVSLTELERLATVHLRVRHPVTYRQIIADGVDGKTY